MDELAVPVDHPACLGIVIRAFKPLWKEHLEGDEVVARSRRRVDAGRICAGAFEVPFDCLRTAMRDCIARCHQARGLLREGTRHGSAPDHVQPICRRSELMIGKLHEDRAVERQPRVQLKKTVS